METGRQRWRQWSAALAMCLACSASARAEDPAPAADAKGGDRKAVRQVGERGAKVELKRAGASSEAGPAQARAGALRAAPRAVGATADDPQGGAEKGQQPPGLQRAGEVAAPGAEPGEPAKMTPEERARTRAERSKKARHMRWMALMRHFKRPSEIPPDVRNELRHHARRVARLQRIRALAEEKRDKKSIARVDKLLAREQERHEAKMKDHSAAQAKADVGAPAAAPGAAAPAAAPDPDEADPEAPEAEEQEGAEP